MPETRELLARAGALVDEVERRLGRDRQALERQPADAEAVRAEREAARAEAERRAEEEARARAVAEAEFAALRVRLRDG